MHTCDDCGTSYYVPGQNQPLVINGGCPDCGGHLRPERDQPGGTASDGTYRDDFKQDGNGHNPLQEGILGDWQNRQKRDESFASVQSARVRDDMSLSPSNQSPQMPWTHSTDEVTAHVYLGGPAMALAPELLAGGEAVGGGAAAMGGGGLSGSIGGLMSGAMGPGQGMFLGTGIANHLKGLLGGGEQPGGNAGPTPPPTQPVNDYLTHNHTALDLPGGGTPSDSTKNQEKPEDVDPKEHSESPENLDDITDETVGVDGAKDFDPASPGMERLMMLLPLVLHYHDSEESGADDPLIKALDECLEAEVPGYKGESAEGHNPVNEHEHGHEQGDHDEGEGIETLEKESEPKESAVPIPPTGGNPVGLATCPHCGAQTSPASPICPQCGAQSGTIARIASPPPMVGPLSPAEDALQSANWPEGQVETCPNCGAVAKMALGGCPHCGAQIHQFQPAHHGASHQGPHNPEQVAAVQQLLIDSGRVEEVPNVPIHPWEYADEMAQVSNATDAPPSADITQQPPLPPQEETPPDAGMPVPGMSIPPGQASVHSAADNLAPQCPKCDSHTTGVTAEDGTCECHTCNHRWKVKDDLVEAKVAGPHHHHPDDVQGAPAADQHGAPDLRADQDSSGQWVTDDGSPIEPEQQYELHTPGVAIPDIVTVKAKKPDGLVLEFTGAHNMGFSKEISRQEFDIEGYTLTPLRGMDNQNAPLPTEPQEADYDSDTTFSGQGAGTDSSPHQIMTSWNILPASTAAHVAEEHVGAQPKPIAQMIAERRASHVPVPEEQEHHPERDWLFGDSPESKTAGAKYSPMQQRDLIDEEGVARNSDKMDLSNTHYERQTAVGADVGLFW